LKKNFLEALQLTVIVDKDAPDQVLESYTFSFKYSGGLGDLDRTLASVSLNTSGCVADMKTVQTARLGLEMIVRRLITLSSFLPILPSTPSFCSQRFQPVLIDKLDKRFLEIHLHYTENCPLEYEPPGFNTAVGDSIRFPLNANWRRESQLCGAMDSGYHTLVISPS
jgi:meiosis-specific protein